MQYSQARFRRTFVIRLEDGEILHEKIEEFAHEKSIKAAVLIAIGGAARDSRLVVGPEKEESTPIKPMQHKLNGVHEVSGTGTLFPDTDGNLVLHMHIACGRKDSTVTGCARMGVRVWQVMEVILFELTGTGAYRKLDPKLGFQLLHPG